MIVLHLVNRLLAAVVSLAIVVAAVIVSVEVVRWALDMSSWLVPWRRWGPALEDLRADDQAVLAAAAVAAALGLLLLAFELKRRRPDALPTRPLLEGAPTVTTRAGVGNAATTAARGVSGVSQASAAVRRSTVSLRVRTRARGAAPGLTEEVRSAVEQALADLELARAPRVKVSVEEKH